MGQGSGRGRAGPGCGRGGYTGRRQAGGLRAALEDLPGPAGGRPECCLCVPVMADRGRAVTTGQAPQSLVCPSAAQLCPLNSEDLSGSAPPFQLFSPRPLTVPLRPGKAEHGPSPEHPPTTPPAARSHLPAQVPLGGGCLPALGPSSIQPSPPPPSLPSKGHNGSKEIKLNKRLGKN